MARRPVEAGQGAGTERIEDILQDYERVLHALRTASAPDWLHIDTDYWRISGPSLVVLSEEELLSVGCLAGALGVSLPAASLLVERLVQQGHAERHEDPRDRRRTLITLSPQGRQLIARLGHGNREGLREWIARLTRKDRAALARGLRALAEAATLERPSADPHHCRRDARHAPHWTRPSSVRPGHASAPSYAAWSTTRGSSPPIYAGIHCDGANLRQAL
jgi:DNA-binding MarR family transcriptional regulator